MRLLVRGLGSALLQPCDLTLARGEIVGLRGASGSGKTVFLRALADLDPNEGRSGSTASHGPRCLRDNPSPMSPGRTNAMTGISLGLDTLTAAAVRERAGIEARIALGATRLEALRPAMREAMRRGFMPMINAMAAAGVVSLPGMMTGQILAGVAPGEAVRYQLLIMFLIAGATGIGLVMAVLGGALRLTDRRHRLRPERLTEAR